MNVPPRAIDTNSVAIAAITLTNELIIKLVKKGIIGHDDAASIFQEAIQLNIARQTAVNESAAYLLQQIQALDSQVWPPRI